MLQHETDFNDPKQRFQWAFRNMEVNGFPLAFPDKFLEEISVPLSKCGFVHDPEQQEIHFQPPIRGQDHSMNMSGQWIPIDQPIHAPMVRTVDALTPQEKARLIQELKEEGAID